MDLITSGRAGEAHGRAVEAADRIAREHGALDAAAAGRLLDYITGPRPAALSGADWQHLVNSSLNALRTNPAKPAQARLAGILSTMARSHADPVLRLYAVQHISFWYSQEPDAAKKKQLAALLRELSGGGGEAGVATMVLSDLDRTGELPASEPESSADINRAAMRLLSDQNAATDVRITALHTLTDRRVEAALPQARHIAEDRNESIILRKAAIFAIGRLGNQTDDTDRLKSLSKEHHRLAQAANPALENLQTSN